MIPGSGGSAPSANAGARSVPRSTARICIMLSANGVWPPVKAKMIKGTASGVLEVKI